MTNPTEKTLAIVGLGHSNRDYVLDTSDWAKGKQFDEVWTLNRGGTIFKADRIFRMDDYHEMEAKSDGEKFVNAALVKLSRFGQLVYTSKAYEECSDWAEFPVEDFLSRFGEGVGRYVNSSVPYMLGLALMEGFTRITIYGMDYSYSVVDVTGKEIPPNFAEDGRACTEYWLGLLIAEGVGVRVSPTSTLMDSCRPTKMYGYKTQPEEG